MKKNYKNNVNQKSKEEKIEVEGKVVEVLKGSDYLVELQNGFTVTAYVSGKMRVNMIRILPGDTVTVELEKFVRNVKLLEEKEKLWLFVKIQNTNKPKDKLGGKYGTY